MSNILWDNDTPINKISLRIKGVQDAKRIGAGTPVNANGEIVNDNTAIGLTLQPAVYPYKKPIDILTAGCINEKARLRESEIELSEDCKAALSNIKLFNTDDMSSFGGAPSWNVLKDKPFGEEVTVYTVEVIDDNNYNLDYLPAFAIGDSVTINVDGIEHSLIAFDDEGIFSVGDTDMELECGTGDYGWVIYINDENVPTFLANAPHTVKYSVPTVKPIDTKYLPDALQIGEEVSYIPMVEEQTVTFTDNGNSTKAIATLEGNDLSWGETYVLSFDGAEYTFTVDEGSDEEWGTFKIGDVYVDVYTDLRIRIGSISYIGEHTVSVTKIISNVKKLDDKFLPDTLPKFNNRYNGLVGFWNNEVRSTRLLSPTQIYKKYNNSEIVTISSYKDMDFSVYNITKLAFDFGIISKDITLVINSTESFNISKGTVCMLFFGNVVIIIYDDNVRVVTPLNPITTVRSITFQYTDNTPVNTSSISIYAQ